MAEPTYRMPAKRVAAGALFINENDEVLLVNPTYKPEWEIPGGLVEEDEPPLAACIREVDEEIGLTITPGRLLSLDYRPAGARNGDMLRFVFWGGRLSAEQIDTIRLDPTELSEWRFVAVAEARRLLTPSLASVVAGCLDLLAGETMQYLEFEQ